MPGKELELFIPCNPTELTTQQQHRVFFKNGRPVFIPSKKLKETKQFFMDSLKPYSGQVKFTNAIYIKIIWLFPYRKREAKGNIGKVIPKNTKPDLDNMGKALLDCITKSDLIEDDALISRLTTEKCWYKKSGILIRIIELDQNLFEQSVLKRIGDE